MKTFFLTLLVFSALLPIQYVAAQQAKVSGADLFTGQPIEANSQNKKGLVIVFLSAVCPCSNSHLKELASLEKEYGEFSFVGIHSNTDEAKEPTLQYFKKADLPFPIVQDGEAKIADRLKAFKTPHSFIMKPDGEIAYQGGVSSSKDFERADKKFLREALEDLQAGRAVRTPEGRTLGCAISRGKNVW